MIEYKIIEAGSKRELEEELNILAKEGFKLIHMSSVDFNMIAVMEKETIKVAPPPKPPAARDEF